MNEKKDSNPNPGSDAAHPSKPSDPSAPEDNPWDDDGGGRTLAQDGPSFEMPSNIPSPITVPPPPAAVPAVAFPPANPTKKRSATMMGFGPPGPALPGQTGPGLPMGGGMGFTPPGGVPVTGAAAPAPAPVVAPRPIPPASPMTPASAKPFPAVPLGGSTLQASPAPQSSPDLSAGGGPPSSNKRPPPVPPRPLGAAPLAPPRAGAAHAPGMAATMASPAAPAAPAAGGQRVAVPKVAPVISSTPPPVGEEEWANASQQEDGPTMAVASHALAARPLRDDVMNPRTAPARAPAPAAGQPPAASPMASTGYRPQGTIDKDADTMALAGDDPRLPLLDGGNNEPEEATRAVSREELIRHQDASFVVGSDAMGDEATLAVTPGQIDLGIDPSGMAAALAESIKRESQPNMPGAPAFPAPPQSFQNSGPMGSSGHLPAAPPYGSQGQHPGMGMPQPLGGEHPPPWSQPQPHSAGMQQGYEQQGYDPMMPAPQSNPSLPGYPQSGQHALMQQHQGQQGYAMQGGMPQGYGPNANAPTAQQQQRPMGPAGMVGQPGQYLAQPPGQPPPWMTQPSPPPTGMSLPTKFTPQVILLVAVGAVCLAIFIIGIVLFVTTKF